jgi:hypothetical protein
MVCPEHTVTLLVTYRSQLTQPSRRAKDARLLSVHAGHRYGSWRSAVIGVDHVLFRSRPFLPLNGFCAAESAVQTHLKGSASIVSDVAPACDHAVSQHGRCWLIKAWLEACVGLRFEIGMRRNADAPLLQLVACLECSR